MEPEILDSLKAKEKDRFFFFFFFLNIYLFIYLAAPGLSCGMWDLVP